MGNESASAVILPPAPEHAEHVQAVYRAGIDEGNATFEAVAPTWEVFDATKLPEHRFVAVVPDVTNRPLSISSWRRW